MFLENLKLNVESNNVDNGINYLVHVFHCHRRGTTHAAKGRYIVVAIFYRSITSQTVISQCVEPTELLTDFCQL